LSGILITGGAGQDGSILARQILNDGNQVILTCNNTQVAKLMSRFEGTDAKIFPIDLTSDLSVESMLDKIKPSLIFNLAGFSSVTESWKDPKTTFQVNTLLPSQILTWVVGKSPNTRIIQASSSEIFGGSKAAPQNEKSIVLPVTPYGFSKSASHLMVESFRERFGIFASSAILYNHESPLRPLNFVMRKVSHNVARIHNGLAERFELGKISATRDWGWAPDYTRGMILMSECNSPDDYVFATGIKHSVEEMIKIAFSSVGISDFENYIDISSSEIRSVDPSNLVGNSEKAHKDLGWRSTVSFEKCIQRMVQADIRRITNIKSNNIEQLILNEIC
jgi:GDPmannose 4,6-dehydratase